MDDVLVLRYGQKIRLGAISAYVKDEPSATPSSSQQLGIGYYEKNGRHGILSCVPPLGATLDHLFNEDEYLVLDPSDRRPPGEMVEYGHTVVLVNQHGMVWNNKTGGITGYIGPRPRNIPGEMFVAFRRGNSANLSKSKDKSRSKDKDKDATASQTALDRENSTASTLSSTSSSNLLEPDGAVVRFGDTDVVISVVESNRHSSMFNKHLTNFKKPTSKIVGGYICCDGKGSVMRFTVFPARPKVEQISMMNKLISSYSYGQKIALPMGLLEKQHDTKMGWQHAEIFFKLSNQTTATLPGAMLHEKILAHAVNGGGRTDSEFALPLKNGPGELILKLTGTVPRRALAKLTTGVKAQELSSAAAAAVARAPLQPTPLQKVSALLRIVPVPVFALLYALLTHFLWNSLQPGQNAIKQELIVLVLVLVPAFYLAVKVDHPFSALFHAPARDDECEEGPSTNASLKLIVTEYRFVVPSGEAVQAGMSLAALANGDRSASVPPAKPGTLPAHGNSAAASSENVIVPRRFILAEKGDEEKGRERYLATLAWRQENDLASILSQPWEHFRIIKENYPHYYHKRGKNNEPVYYEKPGKINLKALKAAKLTLKDLMHNYLMVTEFLWQVLEPDDNKKCISVLDVEGIGFSDFAGEAVEYVRNAAAVSGGHYPERCAYIFIINVPSWFNMIWNTVKGMVDEVTRQKVIIVKGKQKILEALSEKIPIENIPEEYGGESVGTSAEEELLFSLMAYLNKEPGAPSTNPVDAYKRAQRLALEGSKPAPSVPATPAAPTPAKKL
ncbi:hypothetical protein P43SY_004101 [Pythium insidiosum]|uniref:CRAL-TRIO domain-containing protein n=1 Tax=Pythium insidiosum TaxID=114742 RepID=A0AAD5LL73_PYTIN|nr:hypothetical protein P43SY_004101 [Pythium insidiosum]